MKKAPEQNNRLLRKLHSQMGFSLSELLVTLVLVGLISAAVAGGISMVARSYTKVVDRADAEQLLSTTLSKMQDELCFARVDLDEPANSNGWSFISGISGLRIKFYGGGTDGDTKGAYMQFVTSSSSSSDLNIYYFTDSNNNRMYVKYGSCVPVYEGKPLTFAGRFMISDLQVVSMKTGHPVLAEIKEPVYVAAINYRG